MGVIEKDIAIISKDGEGNQLLYHPFTKVDNVEGAISAETANQLFLGKKEKADSAKISDYVLWEGVVDAPKIPANTSDLINDSDFITSSALLPYAKTETVNSALSGKVDNATLNNYATKQEIPTQWLEDVTVLNDKLTFITNNLPKTITINNVAYAKQAGNIFWAGILDKPNIPSATSDLINNSGFITSSVLEPYALTETVNTALAGKVDYGTLNNYVTKTELNNKGYLTSIPAEYVTETELSLKGFLVVDDLLPYAKTEIVNQQLNQKVNTSEMINYVTYTSLSKQGFLTMDDLDSEITSISSSEIDNIVGG